MDATTIVSTIQAPELRKVGEHHYQATHGNAVLDIRATDLEGYIVQEGDDDGNGWVHGFHKVPLHWVADFRVTGTDISWEMGEGGPAERGSKHDRAKPHDLCVRAARTAWREWLAHQFVWTAVKYTSPAPWPEPEQIEVTF